MKFWKKILIGLLCVIVLLQIPLIYRRWQTGNLAEKITYLESQKAKPRNSDYSDYKGVMHVHSFLGGHSTGTFDEILLGAEKNQLDFVVMTEHISGSYDTSAMTLRGEHKKILFIGGNETSVKNDDRFLVVSGFPRLNVINKLNTKDFISGVHSNDSLAFVAYPHKFKSWDTDFDGVEIFSVYTNAKKMSWTLFLLDLFWSYRVYPKETFAKYFQRPDENLKKFDELTKTRKLTLFGGVDAHSNMGFHLFGDDSNNKFAEIKLDDYETIFGLVQTHILLKKAETLSKENLMNALKNGNTYIGFDVLSDSSGFFFTAQKDDDIKIIGEEILLEEGEVKLKANAPQVSRFLVFKDGEKFFEKGETNEINFTAKEKGAYRVEVYLDSLGSPFDKMPWIISNPVYVR